MDVITLSRSKETNPIKASVFYTKKNMKLKELELCNAKIEVHGQKMHLNLYG